MATVAPIELETAQAIAARLLANARKKNAKLPELQQKWADVKRAMEVHVSGATPEDLIQTRRPREDNEILEYRAKNYVPFTTSIVRPAIDSLYRIFNEQNYSIQAHEDVNAYLWGNNWEGMDIITWMQHRVMQTMIKDPNGFLVLMPGGPGMEDRTKYIDPVAKIVPSCDVLEYIAGEYVIFQAAWQNSIIQDSRGQSVPEGLVYYLCTAMEFWIIYERGRKGQTEFVVEFYYPHNFGQVPAVQLGGEWEESPAPGYYKSFFSTALPYLDDAIRLYSDHQGSLVTCGHPYREVVQTPCTAQGCNNGYIYDVEHDTRHVCSTCEGKGVITGSSPFGYFVRQAPNISIAGQENTPPDPIRFFSPPTDILRYQSEELQTLIEAAKAALYTRNIEEAQSGVAKQIDREREYAFILKISNNVFDNLIYNLVWWLGLYRQLPADKAIPIIVKPTEFSIKTEADLVEELAVLKQSNAPTPLLYEVNREIIFRRYSTNENILNVHVFLMEYDPLYLMSFDEKLALEASGVITREALIKSLHAQSVLAKILRVRQQAITPADFEILAKELDKALAPYVLENQLAQAPVLRNGNGQIEANALTVREPTLLVNNQNTAAQA